MRMEEVYGYGYRLNKGNNYAQTSQVGVPLNGSRHNGGWGMITTTHHRVIERVQSKRRLHHADSGASCGRSRYHGSSSLARSGGCELTSGRKAGERWRSETKTGTYSHLLVYLQSVFSKRTYFQPVSSAIWETAIGCCYCSFDMCFWLYTSLLCITCLSGFMKILLNTTFWNLRINKYVI